MQKGAALLDSLNHEQREAASIVDGPAVVFAGAGSGKTRIITTRMAKLISEGVRPWEILALTFTNKAAQEMKHRLMSFCPDAERTLVTTFHSACAKWLREFASELGYTSDFTIYDESDSVSLIRKLVKNTNFPIEKDTTPNELKSAISHLKTLGFLPNDYKQNAQLFNEVLPTGGIEVFRAYQEALALANAMDFGDLIVNFLLLLRTNERVRKVFQHRFQYILVDEYQDTNRPQMELISILSERHKNVFVVGDDDQSIYSWRGAVPSNILEFSSLYPNAKVCKLQQNYRSTSNIVNAAAALVKHNLVRSDKTLVTKNETGPLIDFRYETDAELEAWWVAQQIKDEISSFPYDEVAVFYRTNSQSRLLEEAFRREKIPYQIYGAVRFYDRAEIKDILAYIRLIANPNDDVSFLRAMNTPARGLGDAAEVSLQKIASSNQISLWEAAKKLAVADLARISAKIERFVLLIEELKRELVNSSLPGFIERIVDQTEYISYLNKKFPDQAADKEDNVMELVSAVADFVEENPEASLSQWLNDVVLASDVEGDKKGVTMMTLHMAKGLEFSRVFVVGLEESLLPHFNSLGDKSAIEEERRLLYVGMTRAMKKLSLSAAYMRTTWGQSSINDVSRFFSEIPKSFVRIIGEFKDTDDESELFECSANKTSQVSGDPDAPFYDYEDRDGRVNDNPFKIGSVVEHPTYGLGVIKEIQENFGKHKAVVQFEDFGHRKVDLRHLNPEA